MKKYFIFILLISIAALFLFKAENIIRNKIATKIKKDIENKINNDVVNKINYQYFFQQRSNIENNFILYQDMHRINLKKIALDKPEYNRPIGYSDVYKENLLIMRGNGKIINYRNNNISKVDSNIKSFLSDNNYENDDGYLISPVRDFKIFDNEIFVVLIKSKKDPYESDCCGELQFRLTPIILRADIDNLTKNYINFELFFQSDEYSREGSFSHHGGGKVFKINGEIYLAVPDHGVVISGPQNLDSIFGKFVKVINKNEYEIITSGHRNPQGLVYIPEYDAILSTEHGPQGGDEINLLIKGKNYGWPISSLGKGDNVQNNDHTKNGFYEPLHFWNINPGVSELIYVPKKSNLVLKDRILVSSLSGSVRGPSDYSGNHIFVFKFKNNELIYDGKFFLNDRIRDLTYDYNKDCIYALLEDKSELLIIGTKNN